MQSKKADVFVGQDIRYLMKDENFDKRLNGLELGSWKLFKHVVLQLSRKQKK